MSPKKKRGTEKVNEDFIYEEENVSEKDTIKKIRTKLRLCEAERKEYLEGWQRLKADVVNNKSTAAARVESAEKKGKEKLLTDIIPMLDSFDMAFTGDAWKSVDATWRTGIEYIHAQFMRILAENNVSIIGKKGEIFNPVLHEAVEEIEDTTATDNTVCAIVRNGYQIEDTVIRPAQVIVYKNQNI